MKNTGEVKNSRFWVLDKGAFSGNTGLYCPKKTCRTGSKRCDFGQASIFQTHPDPYSTSVTFSMFVLERF